ncbi:hypothetical protein Tco_0205818 [Tanacetum coccineum]
MMIKKRRRRSLLLLVVQNRLTNLSGDDVADFAIALRMFTRNQISEKGTRTLITKTIKDSFMSMTSRGTEYRHGVIAEEKMEHIRKEKSSFHDQGHQQAAKGKDDDEKFGEICWRYGPSDAMHNPPLLLKVSQQTLVSFLTEITRISINFLTPKHAEFDESDTYVLERFDSSAGNPVKEILLKLNLPDHRIFKDGGEVSDDVIKSDEEKGKDDTTYQFDDDVDARLKEPASDCCEEQYDFEVRHRYSNPMIPARTRDYPGANPLVSGEVLVLTSDSHAQPPPYALNVLSTDSCFISHGDYTSISINFLQSMLVDIEKVAVYSSLRSLKQVHFESRAKRDHHKSLRDTCQIMLLGFLYMEGKILLEPTSNKSWLVTYAILLNQICDKLERNDGADAIRINQTCSSNIVEFTLIVMYASETFRRDNAEHAMFDEFLSDTYVLERFDTSAGNPVKEILLKLNLPDHRSILTDSKLTPTNYRRMTKPYSSPRFIANCFISGIFKDGDRGTDSS